MNQRKSISALLAALLLSWGNTSQADTPVATTVQHPEGARLTGAEAIRVATDVAAARGFELREFCEPTAQYEEGTWIVLFNRCAPPRYPGDHFGVLIDDNSGEATFQPGA